MFGTHRNLIDLVPCVHVNSIMPIHDDAGPNPLAWLQPLRIHPGYDLYIRSINAETGRFDPDRCRVLAAALAQANAEEKKAYQQRMKDKRFREKSAYLDKNGGKNGDKPKAAAAATAAAAAKEPDKKKQKVAAVPRPRKPPAKTPAQLQAEKQRLADVAAKQKAERDRVAAANKEKALARERAAIARQEAIVAARPQRKAAVLDGMSIELTLAEQMKAEEWQRRTQNRPLRAEATVPEPHRQAFAMLPRVALYWRHVLWPDSVRHRPGLFDVYQWGQDGAFPLTNTCPIDFPLLSLSLLLSANAKVLAHFHRLAHRIFSTHVAALPLQQQDESVLTAKAVLQAHGFIVERKQMAARLVVVRELIRVDAVRVPDLGHEHEPINLWGSDLLTRLLMRMDPSLFGLTRRYRIQCANEDCPRNALLLNDVAYEPVIQPTKNLAPDPLSATRARIADATQQAFATCSMAHARAERTGDSNDGCGLPTILHRTNQELPLLFLVELGPQIDFDEDQFWLPTDFPPHFTAKAVATHDTTYVLHAIFCSNLTNHFSGVLNAGTAIAPHLVYVDMMRPQRVVSITDRNHCFHPFLVIYVQQ